MVHYKCGLYNNCKDSAGNGVDVRVCIKGFSSEAEYVVDLNYGDKVVHMLGEGDRVAMGWDQITEDLVFLRRIKIGKNSKIIVTNYVSKTMTVSDELPDLNDNDNV
jgi:hypothetical protein